MIEAVTAALVLSAGLAVALLLVAVLRGEVTAAVVSLIAAIILILIVMALA